MVKVRTTINVDELVIRKAQELNINISAFLEDRLREYLALIEHDESYISSYYKEKKRKIIDSQKSISNSKSNNTFSDNRSVSGARGVAWYPSQRAH